MITKKIDDNWTLTTWPDCEGVPHNPPSAERGNWTIEFDETCLVVEHCDRNYDSGVMVTIPKAVICILAMEHTAYTAAKEKK